MFTKPGHRLNLKHSFFQTYIQGYELHYTEEDIKFGFPTMRQEKSQLSIDSIWNDELFDSEKYQDWEDEWAEFDLSKVKRPFVLMKVMSNKFWSRCD